MKRLIPLVFLLAGGCVERLISVRSDPPGAAVYLDGEFAGVTPVEIPYAHYGTRDLALEKRGYRYVSKRITLSPPWWQIFPVDFITDLLLPFRLTDRSEFSFMLQTLGTGAAETEQLKARAAELRGRLEEK